MAWWAQLLGGGLVGALTAVLKLRYDRTKTERDLFDEVPALRSRTLAAEERAEASERECRQLREQVARVPAGLIAGRLEDLNGLARWFDGFTEPIVASSSEDGGSIIYANPAFYAAIGRPKAEILGSAWRSILHPDDGRKTRSVEAAAWYEPVRNFGNRYKHADGHWIPLVWNCDAYAKGLTLCRVETGVGPD